jgi:outer membrane protein
MNKSMSIKRKNVIMLYFVSCEASFVKCISFHASRFTLHVRIIIVVLFSMILLSGCQSSYDKPYNVNVTQQKLRQIETLELQKSEEKEIYITDVNAPIPEKLELTLEKCRAMTLENNLDLKVQLINPAIAAERLDQQQAKFEAAFSAGTSFSKTDTPTSSTLTGSQGDNLNTNLGVQMPLRTGGTLNFDVADSRFKTDNIFSTLNPAYTSDFSASISQPLLRNAGNRVNTYSIRIAESDRIITEAATKLEVIRIIADADRAYWRLYAARRQLVVSRQQYDLADTLNQQAQRFVQAGERAQVEVTRTEAGLAGQLEAIIVAENNLRERERELKRTLNMAGIGMNSPTVLIPATEPDPVHYKLDPNQLVKIAMEQRMEMLELELQIIQDIDTIDYMKNQTLPLVTVDYTYNINGLGPTRSDSFDLLFDKRFEDHRAGLQILIPLGNRAAKSQLQQALLQRVQRLSSRDNRKQLIEYEVLNAADQLEANWQRILASRQSSLLEGRLYEAERRQFELGLVTSTDVLRVQADLANAEYSEISALTEYQIAVVDLAYATGTLLGAAKIEWQPFVP